MKNKGLYIVFEGVDGSGKSTQIQALKTYFEDRGKTVVLVREPGSNTFGDMLRTIVKTNRTIEETTRHFLFMADRSEVINKEIIPAIDAGFIVLADRSFLTGMSYCTDVDREWPILKQLNSIALNGVLPDLVINIHISVETMMERVFGRDGDLDQREELVRDNCVRFQNNLSRALKELNILNIKINGELPVAEVTAALLSLFDD